MTKSLHPALRYALVTSAVVAALAISFALFPWHVMRGPLASYASHELQRDVTIGDLDVTFGRVTRVRLDDLSIGNAAWSVDQRNPTARAQGEINARNVELKRIFPRLASPQGSAGRFGGRARFHTEGNSIAELSAAMDGEAAIAMRGGEASTLALVLTNLDLARAAELILKGDETAEMRCAVAAVHATGGVVKPDLLVVDSSAVVITGEGTIDLREERYDLRLNGASKRASLLALRGPILISGTFRTPIVGPAIGPLAARVGASVGLGVLSPPLALLALADVGNAADVDCRALNEEARVQTGTTERIVRAPAAASKAKETKAAREKAGPQGSNPTGSSP